MTKRDAAATVVATKENLTVGNAAGGATGRVVVVGAGLGGHRVVTALRGSGHQGGITLVGDEDAVPYDRPPLSKQVLRTGSPPPRLGSGEEYERLGVELRLGGAAVGLDGDRSVVALADGTELEYDSLVIATGARARTLPFLSEAGARTLRTEKDALELRGQLSRGGRLAVIGGGFIGCEVAASARALGVDVTIVEAMPSLLTRVLGSTVGDLMRAVHEEQGVEVLCGTNVVSARPRGSGIALELSTGNEVVVDTVVVGIGSVPELDWIPDGTMKIDDGILCEPSGRTTVPDVYALGDVARWRHPRLGLGPRCEHWTATVEQAAVVAHNIVTGDSRAHDAAPYVWSDQFDTKLQVVGWPDPGDDVTIVSWGSRGRPVAVFGSHGRLTAAVGLGAAPAIARLRGLLAREEVPLETALAALG